jgi:site-specific DNA-methyltransferase (adenine-specific)
MNRSRDLAHTNEYEDKNRAADDQASGRRMLKNVQEKRANGAEHDAPFGATRNKRSVWTVATSPYKEAHFATFPPALIRPAILAGCPMGGTVLDPFGGSGTTGQVAEEDGRNSVLIELNEKYVKLAERRTAQGGLFCSPNKEITGETKARPVDRKVGQT